MKSCCCAMMLAAGLLTGCTNPEAGARLDAEINAAQARIALARGEQSLHGKGSIMHDLAALRVAVEQQTLAMLEQRRAARNWRIRLAYTADGKAWTAAVDDRKAAALEARLQKAIAGRDSDLQQAKAAPEAVKPLYTMSAGSREILIAQLEYQLAAYRHGFPPYYVPFYPPAEGTTPPQLITVPAGKAAIAQ